MTLPQHFIQTFVLNMISRALENLHVFAFTHKVLPLELIGKFHIEESLQEERFTALKSALNLTEFMYLSTCNRVEFICVQDPQKGRLSAHELVQALGLGLSEKEVQQAADGAEVHTREDAVKHLFKVSASLDSMVIGEREIITQVRKAYENAVAMKLSGDLIRLVVRKTIETAKEIFTETAIFKKPVSVVSLAFHRMRELAVPESSRILMVGAGKTNKAMARFLSKHGYRNIHIFNRSPERAEALANDVGATWAPLSDIRNYAEGFDVLVTCTGASEPIITTDLFDSLCAGNPGRKFVIDLALPGDVDPKVFELAKEPIRHINIEELRKRAEQNLQERSKEISHCEEIIDRNIIAFHDIYKTRQIELAMRDIPVKVREIREAALHTVYAKEVSGLNEESREVLDKVLAYLEKKYISVPMKMAKEVMLNKQK
jgi:glutamyl-tRNA reductase